MIRFKRLSPSLVSGLFLIAGLLAGVACTAATTSSPKRALPKAGAVDDDGTGVLARWSRGESGEGTQGCSGDDCSNDPYGADYYGEDGGYGYGYGYDRYGGGGGGYYGGGGGGGVNRYPYPTYTPPPPQVAGGYTITSVVNGGVIEGHVTWKNAPRVPATIAAKDAGKTNGCSDAVANPTLSISDSNRGVGHTVVYLADIRLGKSPSPLGGTLDEQGCALSPHVQVASPIGVTLQVVSRDDKARAVTVRRIGTEVVASLALPPKAQRDTVLGADGFYEVTGSDHPGTLGWVIVPPNPYYVVTDQDGYYRLDDIPAGEYTLVVWHEPLTTSIDAAGAMVRGKPVEIRTKVKVAANGTVTQNVDLK